MNKFPWELVIMSIVVVAVLAGFGLSAYSSYKVCVQYFPKINPWVCMCSAKTNVIPGQR